MMKIKAVASFMDSFLYHLKQLAKVEKIKSAILSKEHIDKQLGGDENSNNDSMLAVRENKNQIKAVYCYYCKKKRICQDRLFEIKGLM